MMVSLSHLERRCASRVQQYGRFYYMHSKGLVGFKHTLPSTSHFALRSCRHKSTSSVPVDSSDPKEESNKSTVLVERPDWRPMTLRERILYFSRGAGKLMNDYKLYKNIHDASRTRLNAWTLNHPFNKKAVSVKPSHIYDNEIYPGRIPRRQYEQQRRAAVDIGKVAPVVLLSALPFIGYLPMILAVAAPRQILSRQFHNEYEIHHFCQLEYQQRKREFAGLADFFWNTTVLGHRASELNIPWDKQDAAGPIIDALPFYSIFVDNHTGTSSKHQLRQGALQSVDSMPREYLVKLALAVGINQNFPGWLSPVVTELSPNIWLQHSVKQTAHIVSEDDRLLILESHDENGCASLTDIEVMDAWYVTMCAVALAIPFVSLSLQKYCLTRTSHALALPLYSTIVFIFFCSLMRGLPVNVSHANMRECLTNHLQMIASVKRRFPPGPTTEGFGLFTLHLTVIRDFLKSHRHH